MKTLWENAKAYIDDLYTQKVDAIPGKQLSTNDYTDEDKERVDNALIDDNGIYNDLCDIVYNQYNYRLTTSVDILTANVSETNSIKIITNNIYNPILIGNKLGYTYGSSIKYYGIIISIDKLYNNPEEDELEIYVQFPTKIIQFKLHYVYTLHSVYTFNAYKISEIDLVQSSANDYTDEDKDRVDNCFVADQDTYDYLKNIASQHGTTPRFTIPTAALYANIVDISTITSNDDIINDWRSDILNISNGNKPLYVGDIVAFENGEIYDEKYYSEIISITDYTTPVNAITYPDNTQICYISTGINNKVIGLLLSSVQQDGQLQTYAIKVYDSDNMFQEMYISGSYPFTLNITSTNELYIRAKYPDRPIKIGDSISISREIALDDASTSTYGIIVSKHQPTPNNLDHTVKESEGTTIYIQYNNKLIGLLITKSWEMSGSGGIFWQLNVTKVSDIDLSNPPLSNDYTDEDKLIVENAVTSTNPTYQEIVTNNIKKQTYTFEIRENSEDLVYLDTTYPDSPLIVGELVHAIDNNIDYYGTIISKNSEHTDETVLIKDSVGSTIYIQFNTRLLGLLIDRAYQEETDDTRWTLVSTKIADIDLSHQPVVTPTGLTGYEIVTKAEYDNMEEHDPNTIYFIKDENAE